VHSYETSGVWVLKCLLTSHLPYFSLFINLIFVITHWQMLSCRTWNAFTWPYIFSSSMKKNSREAYVRHQNSYTHRTLFSFHPPIAKTILIMEELPFLLHFHAELCNVKLDFSCKKTRSEFLPWQPDGCSNFFILCKNPFFLL